MVAGSLIFDTRINENGFNRGTANIGNSMGSLRGSLLKLGKAMAIAFSITALVKFGKECSDLASDLAEVQNVVDVTFKKSASAIEEFSKSAMEGYGLSITSAKKYSSVLGAMLKSMGMTSEQTLEMSINMTKLSADMASFYNLSNEQAFEKIRAGISGESEPLKQLGINMSVTNLEAFALANGIKKSYSQMSQAEKTLLSYNYLMKATADAQGDFSRTSDSWANQLKILKEQWNSLKTSLGQLIIQVLIPIVQVLNAVVSKLREAAQWLVEVVDLSWKINLDWLGGGNKKAVEGYAKSGVASMDALKDSVSGVGTSAEETQEQLEKASKGLLGFDEVNTLNDDSSSAGAGVSSIDTSIVDVLEPIENAEESSSRLNDVFKDLTSRMKELAGLFKQGFLEGLNGSNFDNIINNLQRIGKSLKDIFTDKSVVESFNNMLDSLVLNTGKVAGSLASVGITALEFFTGSIAGYLEQNSEFIKDRLVGMFDISSRIFDILGDFSVIFADVFKSVFGSELAQSIGADIIAIFVNPFLALSEIVLGLTEDVLGVILKPFIENKELIKSTLGDLLVPIKTLTEAFSDFATEGAKSMLDAYNDYIKPAMDNIKDAFSSLLETVLEVFRDNIIPAFEIFADSVKKAFEESVGPAFDKFMEAIGKVGELIGVLMKNFLEPMVSFLLKTLGPVFHGCFTSIGETVVTIFEGLFDVIGSLSTILSGVCDFLTGVFTGDWRRAWNGIKGIFEGVWNGILSILKVPINLAIAPLNGIIDMLNNIKIEVPEWLGKIPGLEGLGGKAWGFRIPRIPKLARGGIVDGATNFGNFIAGESGKEMVVPLEDTGFVEKLAEALGNAVMGALQFTMNDGEKTKGDTILQVDGRTLARVLAPDIMREFNRMGVVLK